MKINGDIQIQETGTTLNDLITNINNLKPVVLYSNTSGFNTNITLSDSSANYTYIEILFNDNDGYCGSVKIKNPDGKIAGLFSTYINSAFASNAYYAKACYVQISGNTISKIREQQAYVPDGSISNIPINIYTVLGYK